MRRQLYIKLRELREENSLSQTKVAEYLGVSRQAISQWETGKAYPDIDNIALLCNLYKVSMDELMEVNASTVVVDEEQNNAESAPQISEKTEEEEGYITFSNKQLNVLEMLGLAVVLVLATQFPFVGIGVTMFVFIWLKRTNRSYKIIYILCVVCLLIGIYTSCIMIDHWIFDLGTSGIEKI